MGSKIQIIASQIPDDSYTMAMDWIGQNIYVGNRISQTIEVVRTKDIQVDYFN